MKPPPPFDLMTGVDKFDPDRGTRLSTVASWWIWQACRRYRLRQACPITVSVGQVDGSDHAKNPALTAQAHRVRSARFDADAGVAGRLPAAAASPAEDLHRREEAALVGAAVAGVADATILRGYYGLGGAPAESGRQLAARLGVSHQRIAQRREQAESAVRARLQAWGITA